MGEHYARNHAGLRQGTMVFNVASLLYEGAMCEYVQRYENTPKHMYAMRLGAYADGMWYGGNVYTGFSG